MIRFVTIALCAALAACSQTDLSRVRVAQGEAQGVVENGVRVFRSLPYAAAPVGELRFRGPRPAPSWEGVRDATAPGPMCVQNAEGADWGPWTGSFTTHGPISEDCLTLSVWTPARSRTARLPVMVWIPGGGLTDGGEASPIYDGQALARQGVIVVTINYRLNAFGMLAHPDIEPEEDGGRGNNPVRDAIAALQWVRDNIEAFGGDPARVTIVGQSAGGAIAYILLDAPQASGLFSAAILQSAPPGSELLPDRAAAEALSVQAGQALNARSAADLRSADAAAVLGLEQRFNLYVDGVLIRDPEFATPPYVNDVPIMTGITADELSFLQPNLSSHQRESARRGAEFAALYPASDEASARDASLRSTREAALVGLERWARATQGGAPAYMYLWTHTLPGQNADIYRAFHSAEVIYVFGSLARAPERPFTDADRDISARTVEYWANFIKTGDPNGTSGGAWPRADTETPVFMELGDHFAPLPPLPENVREYWNRSYDAEGAYQF
ncbi:MAG: carboxylesterase family protein [Hyphomonadaceae bacterium]